MHRTKAAQVVAVAVAVVPAELQREVRARMLAVVLEGIERLENTPADALDAGEVFPTRNGQANGNA
jgi:predicted lipid carrier protein YhbT